MGKKGSNPPPPKGVVKPPPPPNPPKPAEDDIPTECECDNTHEANNTVCRYCWQRKNEEKNKVWRVTYYTKVMPDLTPDILSAKVRHLVASNHTEAVLLFGRNMPEDCGHSKIDLRPLTQSELLFRKRML